MPSLGCTSVRMRASDAAVSHLTDECVDAATACSSRVSQLYDSASVAFQAALSEAGACVRAVLAKARSPKHAHVPGVTTDRVDPALAAITAAQQTAVVCREEITIRRVEH